MPMDEDKLSKDILKAFRDNMKSIDPNATPQEFQEKLAKAVAKGTITVLKASKTLGAGQENPGKSGVGLTADGTLMSMTATTAMIGFSGGGGKALKKMMDAFMLPIADHLAKNVEVVSTSGFGGQGGPPVGAVPPAFEAAILAALPPDVAAKMASSAQGLFLVKSLALGLGTGMAAAIPGIVPSAGSTGGPLVGIFK